MVKLSLSVWRHSRGHLSRFLQTVFVRNIFLIFRINTYILNYFLNSFHLNEGFYSLQEITFQIIESLIPASLVKFNLHNEHFKEQILHQWKGSFQMVKLINNKVRTMRLVNESKNITDEQIAERTQTWDLILSDWTILFSILTKTPLDEWKQTLEKQSSNYEN